MPQSIVEHDGNNSKRNACPFNDGLESRPLLYDHNIFSFLASVWTGATYLRQRIIADGHTSGQRVRVFTSSYFGMGRPVSSELWA